MQLSWLISLLVKEDQAGNFSYNVLYQSVEKNTSKHKLHNEIFSDNTHGP